MYIQKKNSSKNEIGGNCKFTKKANLRNLRQPNKVFLGFPVVASKSVLFFFSQEENVDAVSSIYYFHMAWRKMEVSLKAFSSNIVQLSISSVALLMRSQATFFFQNFLLVQETSLWIQYFGSWYHHSIQYTGRYCN